MTTTERSQDYWDSIAEQWKSQPDSALWRQHSDAVNRALLEEWWPRKSVNAAFKTDLFDEAIANGLLNDLSRKAASVTGIDLSPVVAGMAQQRFPQWPCVVSDVRKLPFDTDSFDLVVSNSTLDHFESTEDIFCALGELHRVMAPGGEMILTLDNPVNPILALRAVLSSRWLKSLGVLPYFVGATLGPRSLRRMLRETGFEILALKPVMHYPRLLAVHAHGGGDKEVEREQKTITRLLGWERLAHWPTRYLTGYFIAAHVVKSAHG